MTEADIAKIAYAEIVRAIQGIRNDYDDDEFIVSFPSSIVVNGNIYVFSKVENQSCP